jgi:cytohesin
MVSSDVTQLLAAVGAEDVDKVRKLLESGAKPDDPRAGRSPLIQTITLRHGNALACNLPILQLLLDHGADPRRLDVRTGSLPLLTAFAVGNLNCAMALRKAGAPIDSREAGGSTILNAAVDSPVSRSGDMSVIDAALSWGMDINGRTDDGRTPLHEAVWIQSPKVIEALIVRGADQCLRDKIGDTALEMAIKLRRNQAIIDALSRAASCPSKDK